jgi:hypothetical protein
MWEYPLRPDSRTVDVHVAQLQAKLGPDSPIRAVRGIGYAATRRDRACEALIRRGTTGHGVGERHGECTAIARTDAARVLGGYPVSGG